MSTSRLLILVVAALGIATGAEASAPPGNDRTAGEFNTLEDLFGDTGNRFRGAISFINFEGTAATQAEPSYGLAVDDPNVVWKEVTLAEDETVCATSGSCATVEVDTTNIFDGQAVIGITLLEDTPDASNDCDLDGTPDGTDDCNGNAISDLVVKTQSEAELEGEIVYLDSTGSGNEYKGSITLSSLGDTDAPGWPTSTEPGTLFVADQAAENPTVTVTYIDNDDGTGAPCANDVDPLNHGIVQTLSTVFLGTTCEVTVAGVSIVDNGDGDLFPDKDETIDMFVNLINNCGFQLNDCVARISSLDLAYRLSDNAECDDITDPDCEPAVDCIFKNTIDVGQLGAESETVAIPDPFTWKVGSLRRLDINSVLRSGFSFTMTCTETNALSVQQFVFNDLDLDLEDLGQTPVRWEESFESGTLGSFTNNNLDEGIPGNNNAEGLQNGDGFRCQYNDPDWPNSATYGSAEAENCFPAENLAHANAVFWGIDGSGQGSPDGGRAKTGSKSLYYGIYLTSPAGQFTTPMATLDAAESIDPINLGVDLPLELSFWSQISLTDSRGSAAPPTRSADRGAVELQLADDDAAGTPLTPWIKLEPFQNTYDQQGYDNFFNCMFDPVDDGNDEDSFFDPTDPFRRLGPSSTCHPGFNWSYCGDTDDPFQVNNIGNCTTEPDVGDSPDLGVGTWAENKVDLAEYVGRRVRIRFLVTSIKAGSETMEEAFQHNPTPADDGWWVDDVSINKTLLSPAQLLADFKTVRHCTSDPTVGCITDQDCINQGESGPCVGEAPQCGATCTSITAAIETDPDQGGGANQETLGAPGQAIEIDASSSGGTCLSGSLQYRYSSASDVLRDWSENPVFAVAPTTDADITVEARCSTDPTCTGATILDLGVTCPSSGSQSGGSWGGIGQNPMQALDSDTFGNWGSAVEYEVARGQVSSLDPDMDQQPDFDGFFIFLSGSGTSFDDATPVLVPNDGFAYIVRGPGEFCNQSGLWTSDGAAEAGGTNSRDEGGLP